MQKHRKSRRSPPVRKMLVLGFLFIATVAAGVSQRAQEGSVQSLSLYEQIEHFVKEATDSINDPKTTDYTENFWKLKDNGNTPTSVFDYVRGQKNSKLAWDSLCKILNRLPDVDLAYFQDEIKEESTRVGKNRKLVCAGPLLKKIDAYWSRTAKALNEHLQGKGGSRKSVIGKFEIVPEIAKGVRELDAATGPVLPGPKPILDDHEIVLTFDDGPNPKWTLEILDILKEYGEIRANFFMIGENAKRHPEIAKLVRGGHHIIGSHTMTHPTGILRMDRDHAQKEIKDGQTAVANALRKNGADDESEFKIPFFRFPYGAWDEGIADFVKRCGGFEAKCTESYDKEGTVEQEDGMASFFWNMDSLDWKYRDTVKLYDHISKEIDRAQRGILLFHDIHPQTAIVLPKVLEKLRDEKYKLTVFVPR